MIKIAGLKLGANFTPKRRGIVVNSWVREELNLPNASKEQVLNEITKISNKAHYSLDEFNKNNKNPQWRKETKKAFNQEVNLVKKVFGKEMTHAEMQDYALAYYHLRNKIIQTLKTGKFSRYD